MSFSSSSFFECGGDFGEPEYPIEENNSSENSDSETFYYFEENLNDVQNI